MPVNGGRGTVTTLGLVYARVAMLELKEVKILLFCVAVFTTDTVLSAGEKITKDRNN